MGEMPKLNITQCSTVQRFNISFVQFILCGFEIQKYVRSVWLVQLKISILKCDMTEDPES